MKENNSTKVIFDSSYFASTEKYFAKVVEDLNNSIKHPQITEDDIKDFNQNVISEYFTYRVSNDEFLNIPIEEKKVEYKVVTYVDEDANITFFRVPKDYQGDIENIYEDYLAGNHRIRVITKETALSIANNKNTNTFNKAINKALKNLMPPVPKKKVKTVKTVKPIELAPLLKNALTVVEKDLYLKRAAIHSLGIERNGNGKLPKNLYLDIRDKFGNNQVMITTGNSTIKDLNFLDEVVIFPRASHLYSKNFYKTYVNLTELEGCLDNSGNIKLFTFIRIKDNQKSSELFGNKRIKKSIIGECYSIYHCAFEPNYYSRKLDKTVSTIKIPYINDAGLARYFRFLIEDIEFVSIDFNGITSKEVIPKKISKGKKAIVINDKNIKLQVNDIVEVCEIIGDNNNAKNSIVIVKKNNVKHKVLIKQLKSYD